jgi:translation initiation factor eIF-2B subunit alpha
LTHGASRAVSLLLRRATEYVDGNAPRRFKVIYVIDESYREKSEAVVSALRAKGIAVATIPESGVAHIMLKADMVLVGAEVITAQGGILSRLGTYQIAKLAKADRKPLYVAAEQFKLGQTFPVGQFKFGHRNYAPALLDFRKDDDDTRNHEASATGESEDEKLAREVRSAAPLDFTPPELITSFICDHGIKSTQALAHQVIDMFVA